MAKIFGDLATRPDMQDQLASKDVPEFLYDSLSKFAKDPELQVNTAYANRKLVNNQHPENIDKMLKTQYLGLASTYLLSNPDNHDLADYVDDTIIECTYQKNNKQRVQDFKVGDKIIKVLEYFSRPENYNPELCEKCLKVLGNLTFESKNNERLANSDITPALIQTLKTSQIDPQQAALILGVLGNMSFQYNPPTLAKIVNDGAISVYAACLEHFDKVNNLPLFLMTVDGLSNIAHNSEICKVISGFDLIPPILRCLKAHQDDSDICYKLSRCLYRLCNDDDVRQQVIDKNGHEPIIQTTNNQFEHDGTLLNCLRLANRLSEVKDPELFEEIFNAGIPNVILKKWTPEVKDPHNIEILKLLTAMN